MFSPVIDRLAADKDTRLSVGVAYIENFRKLLEGKTQLLGPFGNGARNLVQISDAPFSSITDQ